MIELLFIAVIALVFLFAFVLLFGAPYLPTLAPQAKAALELADLKPGDHLLELGCGDGRVMVAAAEQGMRVTGYELNPILAFISWVRTRRFKGRVKVIWGNFWTKQLPPADAIFVFLLPKYMERLDNKIVQSLKLWHDNTALNSDGKKINPVRIRERKRSRTDESRTRSNSYGVKLVSFAFTIPHKQATAEKQGVHLYTY
jgi:SAM-dependent methyltransferase